MTAMQLPTVAKKVFYACKKCETERYQVVIAHATAKSARLECEVCKTKNLMTIDEPKSRRAAVPKKKSAKATANKVSKDLARWQQLRETNSEKPAPYNMKASFETGAALEHPKFGLGFVIHAGVQAIQVVFEDQERSLVHNRQQ
jgi:hypothetical protein